MMSEKAASHVTRVPVAWTSREGWKTFGDRINFLSPERQHLLTGRLSILPPRKRKDK